VKAFSGLKPYRDDEMRSHHIQTTILATEQETGLDFSALRLYDAKGPLESTRLTQWINDLGDIET
jgi:endonuclease G, mitochondrial